MYTRVYSCYYYYSTSEILQESKCLDNVVSVMFMQIYLLWIPVRCQCIGRSDTAGKFDKIAERERHHSTAPCTWYSLTPQCLFSQVCDWFDTVGNLTMQHILLDLSKTWCPSVTIYRCFLQAVSSIYKEKVGHI